MTDRQEAIVAVIEGLLLSLPERERREVWATVEYNDVFCTHCGTGSRAEPNPRCQCTNHE
jgi:hypothetical protein